MLKCVGLALMLVHSLTLLLCECAPRKNVCRELEDYRTIQENPNCWSNPDVGATPRKIAKHHGFPFESYTVTTEDGYIITLFRIPHNRSSVNRIRQPVLLQHGIADDSSTWMTLGADSMAFFFVNNGYDVWLSNSRGSKYSSKHVKYTLFDPPYWNFSFHEMGLYDLTAIIDFIMQKTSRQITFVGHSMGSTMSYVYASLKPEHAKKNIKTFISIAPVAFMDHVTSLVKLLVPFRYLIWNFCASIGLYGIGPHLGTALQLSKNVCSQYPFIVLCFAITNLIAGDSLEAQPSVFPIDALRFPSGLSMKTLLHYAQIMAEKGKFQFFDYESGLNMKFYNTTVPPQYPLDRINVPVHLFYGINDRLSAENDVLHLYQQLTCEKTKMEVFRFGHLNFFAGKSANKFHKILLDFL